MKHYKFELGQRLEIFGLPDFSADCVYNGSIVTVVEMPGFHPYARNAYGVLLENGSIEAAIERYLRPTPPRSRMDTDKVVSWEDFDKVTGLKSITFRERNANPDW